MRYIKKSETEPECLSAYKDSCRDLGVQEILNLNCHSLVEARKTCLTSLLELLPKRSKSEWMTTIEEWLSSPIYPAFIELRLQYLRKYLQQ